MPIESHIKKVKNWLVLNSPCLPFIVGVACKTWTFDLAKRYGERRLISFCGIRFSKDGSESQFLADSDEYLATGEMLLKTKFIDQVYSDYQNDIALYDDYLWTHVLNGVSLESYEGFIKVYTDFWTSSAMPDALLVYGEVLVAEVKKKYPERLREIDLLTRPIELSFNARYEKAMLSLAIEVVSNGKGMAESGLKEIQSRYFWMLNNYRNIEPLTVEYFNNELEKLLKVDLNELHERFSHIDESLSELAAQVADIELAKMFSDEDFNQLHWIGRVASWIDSRKERNLLGNYYLGEYLKLFAEKLNLPYEQISFLLPWELVLILSGTKSITDFPIAERKKESIFFIDIENDFEFYSEPEKVRAIWSTIVPKQDLKLTEVKGNVAWKGKVQGRVRVIFDPRQITDFADGDILITGMTRPDFLGLMRKASAFVTDEGGITCHAAIVAREMKKPCIIGTKIATKVFKDGDMVEVDADNGIIWKV